MTVTFVVNCIVTREAEVSVFFQAIYGRVAFDDGALLCGNRGFIPLFADQVKTNAR